MALSQELNQMSGQNKTMAVNVDVTNEEAVKNMIYDTALEFGGLDVLVHSAGIVRAGALDELELKDFNLVTSVNYTSYFLCAKYASQIMKIQNKANPEAYFDIIEINSKSGLLGSNKNFAYAGSKFGGIGLTQSFALELVEYNIKVNAVCPGNFLDGPLWSDPEKGLFVQYLKAGKVPGAKSVEDVKKFYESKVPLKRGCQVEDVMAAILYAIEQKYETGQAIPVTGGQNMLK
jgi:NAD(P)-dependent dehydrogenase (short-subunit alcohol dehydrogenase family)